DRPVREAFGDVALEVGVGGRVVGLLRFAVAEDVDGHGRAAGVGQEVEPAVLPPRAGRRGGETVQKDNRGLIAHGGPERRPVWVAISDGYRQNVARNGRGTLAEAGELAQRPDIAVVPTAPEASNLLPSRRVRIVRRHVRASEY